MSKRKYERWYPVRSIAEFEELQFDWYIVRYGNKYKTTHRSFLISQQYRVLVNKINGGDIWIANRIGESK